MLIAQAAGHFAQHLKQAKPSPDRGMWRDWVLALAAAFWKMR